MADNNMRESAMDDADDITADEAAEVANVADAMHGYNGMSWDDMGIAWGEGERVGRQAGPNATDKRLWDWDVAIAIVTDMTKASAWLGERTLLAAFDGSGLRIPQQAAMRAACKAGIKDMGQLRQIAIRKLLGVRSKGIGGTRTVKVYPLPNGQTYNGSDLVEYQQLSLAAYIDAGVPMAVAKTLIANITL